MIIGERVRLRAISRKDLPDFITWLNDPQVRENLPIYYPLSEEEEEKWFAATRELKVDEQPLAIEIRHQKGWKLIGDIGFISVDWHERSAEIGLFIGDKQCWDKGYGTEAMRLMVAYGFQTLNLNRIFLRVFETNQRGIRCYEKVGFKKEGRLRQAHYSKGSYIDLLMMSILKGEWMRENTKEGSA
jgi:diamine N-acetyltransferase